MRISNVYKCNYKCNLNCNLTCIQTKYSFTVYYIYYYLQIQQIVEGTSNNHIQHIWNTDSKYLEH